MAITDKLQTSADNLHVMTEARSLGFETKSERGDNTLQFHVSLLESSGNTAKSHYFCSPWQHSHTGTHPFCIAKIS